VVNNNLTLQGTATVVGTPGNHGNLGDTDVDAGDNVAIPGSIGQFQTVLNPIPLQNPIGSVTNVSGVIGCIAVLMEEDGTPNSDIAKGHEALDRTVRNSLNALIPTLNFTHQEPTEDEIKAMESKIGTAVEDEIKANVSVWDWLGAFGNMDDKIGSQVFRFSQSTLAAAGGAGVALTKRWKNEGDWEITGAVTTGTEPMWSGWEDLGGILSSAPCVASWEANRLDCFVRGTDNAMWHKWWNGSSWSGWETLAGVITSAPAAVSWGPNRIDCFARGTDRHMYHKWWNGSSWSGWEDLGGLLTSAPAVASWDANRLDCFARGDNDHMWHKWWNGSSWHGWEDLGGTLTSAPAAVSWGPNRIDCFARSTNSHMWHKWWDGSSWHGWEDLGGILTTEPTAVSWQANRLDCFARGTNNHMWHKWWNGSSWSNWEDLGGILTTGIGAVSWGLNRIDCFGRGLNNHMWHKWFG